MKCFQELMLLLSIILLIPTYLLLLLIVPIINKIYKLHLLRNEIDMFTFTKWISTYFMKCIHIVKEFL